MNFPFANPGQPPQQPQGFPAPNPGQPPQQGFPQAGPMGPATGSFQPPFQTPAQQPPFNPNAVAGAARANTFAQMLNEPPRQRLNREKPADGTHVVQFTNETKMNLSQATSQPYLLVSYNVVESSVPQMVHKSYSVPMMLNNRASVQALAEMAKVIFGMEFAHQLASQNASPHQIAELLAQHLCNHQTGQGLFALLNTWRSKKGKNGGPPPSYDEAFVNHDWMMSHQQQFTLAQAQAAGHRVSLPSAAPTTQWSPVPPAPAQQQAFAQPQPAQGFPAPQQPQGLPAPQGFPAPQQPQQPQQPPHSFIPGGTPPRHDGPPY